MEERTGGVRGGEATTLRELREQHGGNNTEGTTLGEQHFTTPPTTSPSSQEPQEKEKKTLESDWSNLSVPSKPTNQGVTAALAK